MATSLVSPGAHRPGRERSLLSQSRRTARQTVFPLRRDDQRVPRQPHRRRSPQPGFAAETSCSHFLRQAVGDGRSDGGVVEDVAPVREGQAVWW